MSRLPELLKSETVLAQIKEKIVQTERAKEILKQRRKDGTLIYDDWRKSNDWQQWRMQQLERQNWECAYCSRKMGFGEKTKLANGDVLLEPQHPTVDHILPKSLFPELALNQQNLVMVCSSCNRKKGSRMDIASRIRHNQLKQDKTPNTFQQISASSD